MSTIIKYKNTTKNNINEKDEVSKQSLTALHLAVKNGSFSIIELLLNHKGININTENSEGKNQLNLQIMIKLDHYLNILIHKKFYSIQIISII